MPTIEEQETTVSQYRNGETYIYTTNPVHLRKLRKDPRATEIQGGDDWARFTVPAGIFDPTKGFKTTRKPMTPEQRQNASERLTAARSEKDA